MLAHNLDQFFIKNPVVINDAFSLSKQREPGDSPSSSNHCDQAGLQWVHGSIACAGL